MKIGNCEYDFRQYGDNRFQKLREYGYTAVDYGLGDTQEIFKLSEEERKIELQRNVKLADEAGIEIYQAHGPWRWPPRDYTPEDRANRMEVMKASIRAASYLGCKNWVIHPIMPMGVNDMDTPDEQKTWDMNKVFMTELLAYAKEYETTICFETMPMPRLGIGRPDDILRFVNEMNDENFKFCLDTGHENVFNLPLGEAVRMAGDDLKCLHIHDNKRGIDLHLYPQMGTADWKDFCQALVDINYQGVFMMETGKLTNGSEKTTDLEFKLLRSIIDDITADFPSLLAE